VFVSSGGQTECADGNVELVHESCRFIFQSNIAMKPFGQAADEARAKTATLGLMDGRAAPLGPCQLR